MKKIETELREAIERADVKRIGEIIDLLRFRYRADYGQCYAVAARASGISESEWDELLYEVDQAER